MLKAPLALPPRGGEPSGSVRFQPDRVFGFRRIECRFRPESVFAFARITQRESADPRDAGGLLFDLGTHIVDQAVHLLGRPSHLYAEVARRRRGAAVDDDDFIALHHRGDVVVHLWASLVAAGTGPRLRVRGLLGTYVKETLDGQEAALRSGVRPDAAAWVEEPPGWFVDGAGATPVESVPGRWRDFYTQLHTALRTGGQPPVSAEDAVAVLEILEAARSAAGSSRVVPISYSG